MSVKRSGTFAIPPRATRCVLRAGIRAALTTAALSLAPGARLSAQEPDCWEGDLDLAAVTGFLAAGCDVDDQGYEGATPLHLA